MTDRERDSFTSFDERLRAAKARSAEPEAKDDPGGRGHFGPGIQAGIDVVGGVAGGLLIGYGLDTWLGTTPILIVVFLVLGSAAGLRNALRTLNRLVRDADGG